MPVISETEEDSISQTRITLNEMQQAQEVLCETISKIEHLSDHTLESITPEQQTTRINEKVNEIRGRLREAIQSLEKTNEKLETTRTSFSELYEEYQESIRSRQHSPVLNGIHQE